MINAGILDANFFLRIIIGDQPHQALPSKALLQRIARGDVAAVLLPTVVLEIVFAMERQYGSSREQVCDALLALFRIVKLEVVNREQLIGCLVDYRDRRGISFADAYHCSMARDFHDGAIVSFDRKLTSIPGVTRKEPNDV